MAADNQNNKVDITKSTLWGAIPESGDKKNFVDSIVLFSPMTSLLAYGVAKAPAYTFSQDYLAAHPMTSPYLFMIVGAATAAATCICLYQTNKSIAQNARLSAQTDNNAQAHKIARANWRLPRLGALAGAGILSGVSCVIALQCAKHSNGLALHNVQTNFALAAMAATLAFGGATYLVRRNLKKNLSQVPFLQHTGD